MKRILGVLLSILQDAVYRIGKMSFWGMALLDLCLRVFVVRPLGALLALAVSCIWISRNVDGIRVALTKFRHMYTTWGNSSEKQCPWYESKGGAEIIELVDWLSSQGVSSCNLAEEIELPDKSQWYAISKSLNEDGMFTQISGDAFVIQWRLPRKTQSGPAAA